jgi:hypothetical protein
MFSSSTFRRQFSRFRRHLPPTRALVGAGVAFASYFVSTVWKSDVDDRIGKINKYIDRIAAIETRLNELPAFQTYSHYWLELIELERVQIHILNRTINKNEPESFPVLEMQKDDHRERVFDNLKSTIDELVRKTLPKEYLSLKPLEQDRGDFIFAQNNWWRSNKTVVIQACFTQLAPVQDVRSGAYSNKLFQIYEAEADKFEGLEGPYADFGKAILSQLQRLEIGEATAKSIGSPLTLAFDNNAPRLNPFDQDAASVEANYLARKKWAVACLVTAKEATFGIISEFLRQLRSEIDTAFLVPLRKKKNMIGDLEIMVYVVSGLIALFGFAGPRT